MWFSLMVGAFCALCAHGETPQQVHIALAGKAASGASDAMAVSWVTMASTNSSTVRYGVTSGKYDASAQGSSSNYYSHWDHHAVMTALKPSTVYYYVVGDPAAGWSTEYTFKSAPTSETTAFKVSIYGDMGYGKDGHAVATRNRLESIKSEVDFFFHVGDVSYADDAFLHHPVSFDYEKVYNGWMNWMENITTKYPYMVMPGNHESECHSPACLADEKIKNALKNFTAYNKRFRMPSKESGGVANMWYSFNYGNAHFIAIDTETDYPDAPEENHGDSGVIPAGHFGVKGQQLAWLEQDLIEANRTRSARPWIFVGGHRPMYTCGDGEGPLKKAMEDLFHKYGVDIYFLGHVHSYARTYPVYKGDVQKTYTDPTYPVHVLVGGAGCDEMDGVAHAQKSAWCVYADSHYGTGVLEVVDDSTVKWSYITSEDGKVKDEFTLTKKR